MPNQILRTIKSKPLKRTLELSRSGVNEETRTVPVAFSSEEPVSRWFGNEILDHSRGSVRLERLKKAGAVLWNHNPDDLVGVPEDIQIGSDKVGRASIRFGKSAKAEEIYQGVLDGTIRSISVGYMIHKMQLEETGKDTNETYRAVDWEPYEISLVSIPADATVGVGREREETETEIQIIGRVKEMKKCTHCGADMAEGAECQCAGARAAKGGQQVNVQEAEQRGMKRASDMIALGEKFGKPELARKFLQEGKSVEELREAILESYGARRVDPAETPEIGLGEREKRAYNIVRAIGALISGNWKGAELEKEASDAAAKRMGKTPQGFFVPYDIMADKRSKRDLTAGVATEGGYLVDTQMLSIVELIRNKMKVKELGATILGGLQGDIAIPKQTGGATAYWVGENGAPTESQQALGQIGMRPKTVGAFTDISRRLLMQGSIDVEAFVRNDLAITLALAIDLAAINGSGLGGQPLGILKTTGIGDVAGGINGAAPTYAHMVALETAVADANADSGSLAYLTNSKVRGKLKQTQRFSSTDTPVWTDGGQPSFGLVNGYKAAVSNQVPKTLTKGSSSGECSAIIYGNWADLVIAEWGALDILVDPYTGGAAGTVRVRVLEDVDVAVRYIESFSAMQDILTT